MHKITNLKYLGIIILSLLLLFAFITPLISNIDPNEQDLMNSLVGISSQYFFGTDQFGRDMFIRLAYATQLSVSLAFFITLSSIIPGILLGVLAAYKGGIIEKSLTLFSDMILALPGLLLILLVISFSPGNTILLHLALSLTLWVEFYKVSRAKTKTILIQPYIEATKLLGFSSFYILRKEIIPGLYGIMITLSTFTMSTAIISLSTLSALGVGVQPPTSELGNMIVDFLPYFDDRPLLIALPTIIIFLLVLSLQLIINKGNKNV